MDMLQLREKEIFETLRKIKKFRFVVIGGYAANCYALPRFSVDCDIVVENIKETKSIGKYLEKVGYLRMVADKSNIPYQDKFIRYEKEVGSNFMVSIDILVNEVFDRQTNTTFSAERVFENSSLRFLKGKTITEELKLRIINPNALLVMKFISCRTTDVRDAFMLITKVEDINWVKEEIDRRCYFKERFEKIKDKVTSTKFKDNLQGVYGYIDEYLFEKHKKALLQMVG